MGFPESFIQQFGGQAVSDSPTPLLELSSRTPGTLSNLQLNYGLRYDVVRAIIPASSSISDAGEQLLAMVQGVPRDRNNWVPRIGLAWDPLKNGATVIRASYGLSTVTLQQD
jgi:outer membrane receptor protein involved in Fe transport